MDDLCTDESDVIFTESPETGKSKPTSRSRSVDPARCGHETAETTQQRPNSASPSRRRPERERAQSTERKPISGVLTMKPTNLEEEMDTFFASAFKATPQFTYAKSESCIKEAFSENSNVCFELLPEAERILARVKTEYGSSEAFLERLYGDEKTDPNALRQKILEYLKEHNMEERVKVRIVESGLSAASVSKAYCPKQGKHMYTVNIANVPFSSNMIQGTCDHEIGTHLLRMRNDEMQVWHGARAKYKLANPWITEEGFATLNTYQSMPCKLLFPQALRYYAVCRGATLGFVELFHELQGYVDNPKLNWQMCCRVKRGLFDTSQPGAFNMDQAYFKGAVEILRSFNDIDLVQLYSGQVAVQDLDKVKFLHRRDEVVLPWFLNCPEALELYKEHCHQLIHENQIACTTGRRPSFFRAAVDLLKRIPRLTKATPAFLQRKVHGSHASKPNGSSLDNSSNKSTTEQDQVSVSEQLQNPLASEKVDHTLKSETPQPNDACSTKLQELRCCAQVLSVGKYMVTYNGIRVGPEAALGRNPVAHLSKGTKVNVLEIIQVEQRIRARIANPVGWVSLMNTETGFQWVVLESTLAPSVDHSESLQDGDQKQDDAQKHETQKREDAIEGSKLADPPAPDHQPQEAYQSEQQEGREDQPIQATCNRGRVKQTKSLVISKEENSPQPQDGMHESEQLDLQDGAGEIQTSDVSSSDKDLVVEDASVSIMADNATNPPQKIEDAPSNDASHDLVVEGANASIVPDVVTNPLEKTEDLSSNDARRDVIDYATVSLVPAVVTKPLKTGHSAQKTEVVQEDLTQVVRDLADAVKEWKCLKAEFDATVPCELAKAVEVVCTSKTSRRLRRRSSSKAGQEKAQCAQSLCGCSVVEEKAVDSKSRHRNKRKTKKATSKEAGDFVLKAVI